MSGSVCRQCGCGVLERDSARGDTVCTNCGAVLEENAIVNEVQFQENSGGGHSAVGQYINPDRSTKVNIGGVVIGDKQSREATLQNARRRIQEVAGQLRLNAHCVEQAFTFYKMALSRSLTKGRPWTHTVAACLYITCRLEGTSHFLLDFSDALQVNVFELGHACSNLARNLYITLPLPDPCVFVMRFAHALEFGDKEHDVAMIALRLVQRMKRDWIAIGRRPTGLCGAALLIAARYHNFNRTVSDIVRVANIGETVIRRRLDEFASTPTSSLTLDDFMTVDLEQECDPPAYSHSRRKVGKQTLDVEKLDLMRPDLVKAEREIEKLLENKASGKFDVKREKTQASGKAKLKKLFRMPNLAYVENTAEPAEIDEELAISQEFLTQDTLRQILPTAFSVECTEGGVEECKATPLSKYEKFRPTLESLGVKVEASMSGLIHTGLPLKEAECPVKVSTLDDGALDLSGIDDEEIDHYLLRQDEISIKRRLWNIRFEPYVLEMEQKRIKREDEQKMLESQGLGKKRRQRVAKPVQSFASFGEAVEKIVQEKKLSSKINYDVLRSLIEPFPQKLDTSATQVQPTVAVVSSQNQPNDVILPENAEIVEKSANLTDNFTGAPTLLENPALEQVNSSELDSTANVTQAKPSHFRKKPKPNLSLAAKKLSS